jgi:hypothetical protein
MKALKSTARIEWFVPDQELPDFCTVRGAIWLQKKYVATHPRADGSSFRYSSDKHALEDFLTVNWAWFADPEDWKIYKNEEWEISWEEEEAEILKRWQASWEEEEGEEK